MKNKIRIGTVLLPCTRRFVRSVVVPTVFLLTAPTTLGTYHVIATSQADSTKSAVGIPTVAPVTVSIVPAEDALGPAGVRAFTTFATGSDQTVTWAIQG